MRIVLLYVSIFGFSIYAWRNWFASLCALILLMALLQNPEMPRTLLGIQGLSLFNILMANVLCGWWNTRVREGWQWDMPPPIFRAYLLYGILIVVGYLRFAMDFGHFESVTTEGAETGGSLSFLGAFSEYLVNTFKWTVPGLLLYDGCRTAKQQFQALVVIATLYFVLAVLVIRYMHLGALISGGLDHDAGRIVHKHVGYFRVSLSMMLAGGSWAVFAFLPLAKRRLWQLAILGGSFVVLVGQGLTGGRGGYLTWVVIGGFFSLVRYRKMLLLIPTICVAVLMFLPGVTDRLLTGLSHEEGGVEVEEDSAKLTAGRFLVWPIVIEEIKKTPIWIWGDGRQTYARHQLQEKVGDLTGDDEFGHPHCAYLEFVLDNGLLGLLAIMPFYYLTLKNAFGLFRAKDDPLCMAVGGVALALVLALLVAGVVAQTLYPMAYDVGMWAAIGLMFRVAVDRARALERGEPAEAELAEPELVSEMK